MAARRTLGFFKDLASETWERSVLLLKFGSIVYVFNQYIMEVTMCLGPSMLPTFNVEGDIVLLEHLTPKFDRLKPGDVVVSRSPLNPRLVVCKRILGCEGDRVRVLPPNNRDAIRDVLVPKGHVWLQGDNRYNSTDSRHYGPVPAALVKGRVFYKIWPPKEWGPVESRTPASE